MTSISCAGRPVLALAAVIVVLAGPARVASSADPLSDVDRGALDPALTAKGWHLLQKHRVPATLFTSSGSDELRIETVSSNALIYRLAGDISPGVDERPWLSWAWRTDVLEDWVTPAAPADPDWPVAVYAFFAVDKLYVSWWQRMLNRLRFSAVGLPAAGKFVTYVWAVDQPPADVYPNPYLPEIGAIYVLRRSAVASRQWHTERRDLRADFESAFGHPAGELLYLAISADSEQAGGKSVARIRRLRVE